MIDLSRVPVVRALVPYAGGSMAGYLGVVAVRPYEAIVVGFMLSLAVGICFVLSRINRGKRCRLLNPMLFLLLLWTGAGTGVAEAPRDPHLPVNQGILISGRILEVYQPLRGRVSFEMDLRISATPDALCFTSTRLKAFMELPSDSVFPVPGEIWMMTGRLEAITTGGNPGEIDFAAILRRKNCWYRFYCDSSCGSCRCLENLPNTAKGAAGIREGLVSTWDGPPGAVSILKAVCLGDRSGLNENLQQSYARAGGMHVLAVSGLHVGLIWWVLHRLFSILVRLTGREIIRVALITILLWFYAWVTGFSSSVCRSVTMFSLFSLAGLMNQPRAPVNVILLSMFIMLVIHPGRLLDVGFQLSYVAVLSIVTLHPLISKLIRIKNRALRWAWEATAVSLAAQVGTLPLVVHYFHQIPLYALLTNLLVIPLLSCIIALFVISVPLMTSGIAAGSLNKLLMILGGWMNRAMESVAALPGSVLGNLYLDTVSTTLWLVLVFLGILLLKIHGSLSRIGLMLTLGLLLAWSAVSYYTAYTGNQVVVANFYKGSLVTFREGTVVDHYIWCFDPTSLVYMDNYLETAWGRRHAKVSVIMVNEVGQARGGISACSQLETGIWLVGNDRSKGLVVSGSPGGEQAELISQVQADFLLLSGEPVLTPVQRGILFSGPGDLIADGTNRKWYTDQLEEFADQPHITPIRGAYRVQY
ncbi:MAG: ComEC/Rec2 family competence protein [Bacteroidota bacterium]